VAYLLLDLGVDPAIAFAFEQSRVDGEELQAMQSAESMHATAPHIRKTLFVTAFRRISEALDLQSSADSSRFHIFLSYRRSHKHWSRCVKQRLEKPAPGKDGAKRMYRVFFDMDDIGAVSDFQGTLEARLKECQVVLVLMTQAPSGPKGDANGRFDMTSFETMAHFHKIGKTDWCLVEIEIALKLNKLIIPLYPGSQGQPFIGAEMSRIMHIESAKAIGKCNALPIHDDMFAQSIQNIREKIEERYPDLGKM